MCQVIFKMIVINTTVVIKYVYYTEHLPLANSLEQIGRVCSKYIRGLCTHKEGQA